MSLMLKPSPSRNARDDHRRGAGIAAIEHDMALGPSDEKGRGIGRANVVEVASDAERFGGPLPASLCRVQPPTSQDQRKNTGQCQDATTNRYRLVKWGNRHSPRASSLNPD